MKEKIQRFTYLLLITTFCNNQVFGQEEVNITTGFGYPELLNIGFKYQNNQTQIGLSVGGIPEGSGKNIVSISSDIYYHFGGSSELTSVRPWYGRIGVNYLRNETERIIGQYVHLNTRVGRDFNISRDIGIQIDVGALFQLHNKEIRKKPQGWEIDLDFQYLPSFGIGLFYRI